MKFCVKNLLLIPYLDIRKFTEIKGTYFSLENLFVLIGFCNETLEIQLILDFDKLIAKSRQWEFFTHNFFARINNWI